MSCDYRVSRDCYPKPTLSARIIRIGVEQLLALDFVMRNIRLTGRRYQVIDESLTKLLLHVGMALRVHQYHSVLIE